MTQIELHNKIDELIVKGSEGAKREDVFAIISSNEDARQYFFTRVNEGWLDWLWKNSFLDIIKKKAEDTTRYSYSMPELNYLERVALTKPKNVTDIILTVSISSENFNPEVIDRFSRICSTLPPDELKRVVVKIRDDHWISLMGSFNQWGFEYEKMLKALVDSGDYDSVLVLADAILTIRKKEEMQQDARRYVNENPFYFSDLHFTKVFEYLIFVDEKYKERAFKIVIDTLRDIILVGKTKDERVFNTSETFHLYDVDFFDIKLEEKKHISYRDDVYSLAVTVKILAENLIGKKCDSVKYVKNLYEKYISSLPDSNSLWRFRLYVLSLCPTTFKDELKRAFFRLFETEHYYELIRGAEYEKALQNGFKALDENDKREYIKQIFVYFSQKKENSDEQEWRTKSALRILSCICNELTPAEQTECIKKFGRKCDINYEPKPAIERTKFGIVHPRGPITLEEFSLLPISEIITKLKGEWKPDTLRTQNTADDFHNPLNAEGLGMLLKEDQIKRLQDYITNAQLFFERDKIDPHYTYSFFRGIDEIFRENKADTNIINWDGLIKLCLFIKESADKTPFDSSDRREESDIYGGWLASWTSVHAAMADVMLHLITEKNGKTAVKFEEKRDDLFAIISYLLSQPDPSPEDEKIESAKIKTKLPNENEYQLGDPNTTAINSVRGRAFQVFVSFVYLDGKKYNKEDAIKIKNDVKTLYEDVLKRENTQALMFMFGHYLPSFYYRDKKWIQGLLPQIFPSETYKKDLYLAAWEGYLVNNLFEEMFFDPLISELYERAIKLVPSEYTKRQYVRNLDEGLAIHLAIAFMYLNNFNFDSPLFHSFWGNGNTERFSGFISFIGRSFISGDNKQADTFLKEDANCKGKLTQFWDWALEHCQDIDALKEFGFWMNAEKEIFDIPWQTERVKKTLEKTKGIVEWDFGLTRSIPVFAKAAPGDTLDILRLLLLEGGIRLSRMQRPFYSGDDTYGAFQILYQNGDSGFRKKVYSLIDDLIREGGSTFWKLKDILNSSKS